MEDTKGKEIEIFKEFRIRQKRNSGQHLIHQMVGQQVDLL